MERVASNNWRSVAVYFALVALLTVPFLILSALLRARLMPGLSLSAFAIVVPLISAMVAARFMEGGAAVRALFGSLSRLGRHAPGIVAVALGVPLVAALVSWAGVDPGDRVFLGLPGLLALVPVMLLAAIAEEIGWSAFAAERLHGRLGTLGAGLVVGVVWAVWHIPSLVDLGRSADWIAWWSLWALAQRVVMTYLYVRGGSWLWGAVLFHAMSNIVWQAAPDAYDPQIEALTVTAIAIGISVVLSRRAR